MSVPNADATSGSRSVSSPCRTLFTVLGFESTHDTLDAEKVLEHWGVETIPIPAPAGLSARCGIALRLVPADVSAAQRRLDEAGIRVRAMLEMEDV